MRACLKMFLHLLFSIIFATSCATTHRELVPEKLVPLRIYVFECGSIHTSDVSLFSPYVDIGKPKHLADSCYIIKHPKGTLLWDSGLSDELAKNPNGLHAMGGKFHLQVTEPLLPRLIKNGFLPEDITHIAFSHFHSDHTGNANAFTRATLLIQEEEYNAAFGDNPAQYGFDPTYYSNLKNGAIKQLHGDYDIFGDGTVVIKRAIGHTPGHQMLFVKLASGPIVLSGDLYHFTSNRTHKRVPSFNFSKEETLLSMDTMEKFIAEQKATLWIQHDYEQQQTLKKAPQFYE